MRVADLCCGAGGFSEGFRQAEFRIALGVDVWKPAAKTFRQNFATRTIDSDIRNLPKMLRLLTEEKIDVIIGSLPCQEFSVSNQMLDKPADTSILEAYLEIVNAYQPKWWIMEEVPSVAHHIPKNIQRVFVQANEHGLSHKRKRLFAGEFIAPFPTETVPTEHPTPMATEWRGASKDGRNRNRYSDYLGRRATIEECRIAMGFPKSFQFIGGIEDQYTMIGNAVCPPVAKAFAEALKRVGGFRF